MAEGPVLDRKPRGKPSFLQFPLEALEAWWEVSTYGLKKYKNRDSWKHPVVDHLESYHEYMEACNRHLLAAMQTGSVDVESGLPHIFHASWNAAAAVYHYLRIQHKTVGYSDVFKGRPNPPE